MSKSYRRGEKTPLTEERAVGALLGDTRSGAESVSQQRAGRWPPADGPRHLPWPLPLLPAAVERREAFFQLLLKLHYIGGGIDFPEPSFILVGHGG